MNARTFGTGTSRLAALAAAALALGCGDGGKQQVRAVGGIALLDPASLDFGSVAVGLSETRTTVLSNAGVATLNVSDLGQLSPAANAGDFVAQGLPASLGPGESRTLVVRYRPRATGSSARSVALSTNTVGAASLKLDLRGRAVLGLTTASVSTLDFGPVLLGERPQLPLTLVEADASARTQVQLPAPQGPGAAAFQIEPAGTVPMPAGQSLTAAVRFAPAQLGNFDARVDLVPCPTCAAQPVQLQGSAVTQLLRFEPAALDFGLVVAGQSASKPFTVTNLSHQPLGLASLTLSGDGAFAVQLSSATLPAQLAPGQTVSGVAVFSPRQYGPRAAAATAVASRGEPSVLALTGSGVGPRLVPRPSSFSMGSAVPQTIRTKPLVIANGGYDPQGNLPLIVSSIQLQTTDVDAWSFQAPPLPWTVGGPGSAGNIVIAFSPQHAGFSAAVLTIGSNDPLRPSVTVRLSALGRILSPCSPRLEPAGIVDFGNVQVLHPSTQGFEIINDGEQDCILGEPTIIAGGPQFSWPGNVQPGDRTLPPGGRMSVRVQFFPDSGRRYQGEVEMYLSNPSMPRLRVLLQGTGNTGCFVLSPGTAGFVNATSSCTTHDQTLYAHNWCGGPVRVTDVSINRPQFVLAQPLALPATIAQNGVLPIVVHYQPSTPGDDVAALSVTASTSATPYQSGLTAGVQPDQLTHDAWNPPAAPKIDLLMIVGNGAAMGPKQDALVQNLDHLWNQIALANADFHIAVTTTGMAPGASGTAPCPGGALGGEAGRFFPVDASSPRLLLPQTSGLKAALASDVAVGACQPDVRILEPAVAALTPPLINAAKAPGTPWPSDGNAGFLREDARLSLLVVSDTDDDVRVANPPPVSDFVQAILGVKHGAADLVSFAAVAPRSACPGAQSFPTPRLQEAANDLGGQILDLCDLPRLGSSLDSAVGSLLLPLTSFGLSARPYDPAQLSVAVDGAQVGGWMYDQGTNRIVFAPQVAPAPGSHVTADYVSACR